MTLNLNCHGLCLHTGCRKYVELSMLGRIGGTPLFDILRYCVRRNGAGIQAKQLLRWDGGDGPFLVPINLAQNPVTEPASVFYFSRESFVLLVHQD